MSIKSLVVICDKSSSKSSKKSLWISASSSKTIEKSSGCFDRNFHNLKCVKQIPISPSFG